MSLINIDFGVLNTESILICNAIRNLIEMPFSITFWSHRVFFSSRGLFFSYVKLSRDLFLLESNYSAKAFSYFKKPKHLMRKKSISRHRSNNHYIRKRLAFCIYLKFIVRFGRKIKLPLKMSDVCENCF